MNQININIIKKYQDDIFSSNFKIDEEFINSPLKLDPFFLAAKNIQQNMRVQISLLYEFLTELGSKLGGAFIIKMSRCFAILKADLELVPDKVHSLLRVCIETLGTQNSQFLIPAYFNIFHFLEKGQAPTCPGKEDEFTKLTTFYVGLKKETLNPCFKDLSGFQTVLQNLVGRVNGGKHSSLDLLILNSFLADLKGIENFLKQKFMNCGLKPMKGNIAPKVEQQKIEIKPNFKKVPQAPKHQKKEAPKVEKAPEEEFKDPQLVPQTVEKIILPQKEVVVPPSINGLDILTSTIFYQDQSIECNPGLKIDFFQGLHSQEHLDLVLQTICAFLNSNGGDIFIGVQESKKVSGVKFASDDKEAALETIKEKIVIGIPNLNFEELIKITWIAVKSFETQEESESCVIRISVKQGNDARLYGTGRGHLKCFLRNEGENQVISAKLAFLISQERYESSLGNSSKENIPVVQA